MVSHESVTALLKLARVRPGRPELGRARSAFSRVVADWLNRRTARAYQRVICTTGWAAAEFERIGAANLARVPLGVDLATFSPQARRAGEIRARYAGEGQTLLVHCGRLSAEKKPQRSLTTLATLRAAGMPVRLVVAGGGPLRTRLGRRAARAGLPVTFTGFLAGRAELAALLARPERGRRAAARARAERYDWDTAVRGFLAVHGAAVRGTAVHGAAAEPEVEAGRGAA
jgi:alpha-1,6-mannosyltransferase